MGSLFGGGGGSSAPKPPSISKSIRQGMKAYIGSQREFLPQILGLEQQYRPEFQKLNLADVSQFGLGLMGLMPQFTQGAAQQLGEARGLELGQMTGQAGLTRGLMQAISPEQASAVQRAQAEADRAYAASQGVSPQERRGYEQQAREAFQASGRLGGNADIVAQAMGREDVLSAKRAQAAEAGQRAFGLAGQFYTAPGLGMLQSTPLSYQTGQQQLGLGLGAIGAGVPQMINPDTGANLGMQYASNVMQMQGAKAQASASKQAGMMGMVGNVAGSAMTAAALI